MYYISEFCRICLHYDKSLVDIMKTEDSSEALINQLKLCVSEVEWCTNDYLLLCESCIERLNTSFEFKSQCLRSTETLKNYVEFLNGEDSNKLLEDKMSIEMFLQELNQDRDDEAIKENMTEPTNKKLPVNSKSTHQKHSSSNLFVTRTNQNTFQNIFLNLIPQCTTENNCQNKSNQQVFINFNDALQTIYTIAQEKQIKQHQIADDLDISQILNESKTEELSIEIDPTAFDCSAEDSPDVDEDAENKDWEELISSTKISPHSIIQNVPSNLDIETTSTNSSDAKLEDTFHDTPSNFSLHSDHSSCSTPVRPNLNYADITNEEKVEFFNAGHFLTPSGAENNSETFECEDCRHKADTLKALHYHIKQFHLGKFPFKCMRCMTEYAVRAHYDLHMLKHDPPNTEMLTLDDFLHTRNDHGCLKSDDDNRGSDDESESQCDHKCNLCSRTFNSSQGLCRHRVRKHNQKSTRKYFIKGMKNAKCHICNREFSTQSYLQLHIKLHYRKNEYRRKVFNKNFDKDDNEIDDDVSETPNNLENLECNEESHKENNMSEANEKIVNGDEQISENSVQMLQGSKGLKIKITLKDSRQSSQNNEIVTQETAHISSLEDLRSKDLMDIDQHVNGISNKKINDTVPKSNKDFENDRKDTQSPEFTFHNDDSMSVEETQNENCNLRPIPRPYAGFTFEVVDGKPKCSYCHKLFSRKHDLKRHINNIHLKSIEYKCHLCSGKFYEAFHLTRHLRTHTSFICCTVCNRNFSVLRDLRHHIDSSHSGSVPLQCGGCNKTFYKVRHLKDHMAIHDRSIIYKCHLCNDEFSESRDLTKHLVEHSGMYSCNICQKTFATEHELTIHLKSYHESKRYECDICHNTYKKKRYLSNHRNNCHFEKKDVEVLIDKIDTHFSDDSS